MGYPLLNDARTPASVMQSAERAVGDGQLGLVGWKEQHVLFAEQPVVHFGYRRRDWDDKVRDGLVWFLNGENRYLLLTDKWPAPCIKLNPARNMGYRHRQNWYLLEPGDVAASCRPRLEREDNVKQLYRANTAEKS